MIILIMGVSGSGKTTYAKAVAEELGARYIEGDAFHPAANLEKMKQGIPLTDGDRQGWLEDLARQIQSCAERGESAVLACSALKQSYRDILQKSCPLLRIVWLKGARAVLAARLDKRRGHFFPAGLLDSQLELLEPPTDAVEVDISGSPQDVLAAILASL